MAAARVTSPPSSRAFASTRQLLYRASQFDSLSETTADSYRCGAAAAVTAAIISGPKATRTLLDAVSGLVAPTQQPLAAAIARDFDDDGELTLESIDYLQDLVQHVFGRRIGPPTTSTEEFADMIRAARLVTRPIPSKRDVGIVARELRPGEMLGLKFAWTWPDVPGNRHVVLVGRDSTGELFLYDSLRDPPDTILRERADARRIRSYLERYGTEVWGNVVFSSFEADTEPFILPKMDSPS